MGRIVSKIEFSSVIRPELKKNDKTIALCHGVFDLVHPGHMIHFEQASQMADVLVVSITSASYVRKGPGRPFFNDQQRMKYLSAISYIDYVILSEGYTVDDIIECVEPDIYVKGNEYADENADITGMIKKERLLVEQHGGCIKYTAGDVFSSTNLINRGLNGISDEMKLYLESFTAEYTIEDIVKYTDRMASLKILVIGDVILDRYTYCTVQGLMSKDIGYSARISSSELYLGGSLAVARHLSNFSNNVTILSIVGNESFFEEKVGKEMAPNINLNFVISKVKPTIEKHRYLMLNEKREEYKKLFAINNISENNEFDDESKVLFNEKLAKTIEDYDAVFVCDFGHGLLDHDSIEIIEKKAKYFILNCQTNSSNYGMNLITKYHRADVFSLNQKELRLAFPEMRRDEDKSLISLRNKLKSSVCYLTKGSQGAVVMSGDSIKNCPAFSLAVKDTVGAGDAFFALGGIAAAVGAPDEVGLFLGNIAGALEANIIGNKESVEKVNVLKYADTLMNI